jgi:four helix bundle protein
MSDNNFRDLLVWQKARALATRVYKITRTFPRDEIFGLTAQMRKAALSIVFNIAEGKGRYTRVAYRSFLMIARGSAFEVDAQLVIASDLEYLDHSTAETLCEETSEISRMLNAMIRKLGP